MARRQTSNARALRRRGARGEHPSRRSSVHARRSGKNSRGAHIAVRPIKMAMKRAMRRVALRDCGQRCVYCASSLEVHNATLDHVYPLARGGTHDPANVVAACGPCNRLKGDMLPHEFFMRHPWAGHHFILYARSVHRALKRIARRAVSLACANAGWDSQRNRERVAA